MTIYDSVDRFSDRVQDYVRYRPGYPAQMFGALTEATGIGTGSTVADVGSGTGISAEPFLRLGCTVFAVEPNGQMRAAAERLLGTHPGFHSVSGKAEDTTLADRSVDLAVAAQAFHWFDPAAARQEFARIVRPGGWIALIWNTLRVDGTPFLRRYEELLQRFGTDYRQVDHRNVDGQALRSFLGGEYRALSFSNEQTLDLEGLKGRLLSSSYAPAAGHPSHAPMLRELQRIFETHAQSGRIRLDYDTQLFFAPVGAASSPEAPEPSSEHLKHRKR